MLIFAAYLALGALAGVLAGLFGIGGGLVIVPALIFSFGWQGVSPDVAVHLALGTSLATIVFTSLNSIRNHARRGGVRRDLLLPMSLGIMAGAALGVQTAVALSGHSLKAIIGCFALLVSVQMAFGLKPKASRTTPGPLGLATAGGVIGWASAIFGIGGGTLTVPFLSWRNVRMQEAVGTSAACGLPIALAGACTNMFSGWQHAGLPAWSTGYVYWPAVLGIALTSVYCAGIGARLAHRLSPELLRRIFALLLAVVGTRFLWSAFA